MRHMKAFMMLGMLGGAACGEAGAPRLEVAIQALELQGVTDAVYTITVKNDVDETVWSRTVTSSQYGDGQGSLTYVGTCDAYDNDGDGTALNVVELLVVDLPPLAPADWVNPTANGPLVQTVPCLENEDVQVEFTVALMRDADQGFFDVAVNFEDIFCSAKLDCVDDAGAPLTLLHNPQTGDRGPTAVMALACTAGVGSDTHLYMDDVQIECDAGTTYTVDSAFDGVAGGSPPLVYGALVMRGDELLVGGSKAYWNVAIGLDTTVLGDASHTGCVLRATGTASDGLWANGTSPTGAVYPYVSWEVPLTSGGPACGEHPLGAGNGVSVVYDTDLSFDHAYLPESVP